MQWMQLVGTWQATGGTTAEHNGEFRKDLIIEVYNLANEKVLTITVYRCWPSKFIAVPDLDAKGNDVAIETLELQHEGWVIDPRTAGSDGTRS